MDRSTHRPQRLSPSEDHAQIDRYIRSATKLAVLVWFSLLSFVYWYATAMAESYATTDKELAITISTTPSTSRRHRFWRRLAVFSSSNKNTSTNSSFGGETSDPPFKAGRVEWKELQGLERFAPLVAVMVLTTALIFYFLPFVFHKNSILFSMFFSSNDKQEQPPVDQNQPSDTSRSRTTTLNSSNNAVATTTPANATPRMSGILVAAVVVMGIAIVTNLLLACVPTVIMTDPVFRTPIYVIRWCEWIPLAGLLTFLSDIIDLECATESSKQQSKPEQLQQSSPQSRRSILFYSLGQACSAFCGILFPFCTNFGLWCTLQIISISLYIPIFVRVQTKRERYLSFLHRNKLSGELEDMPKRNVEDKIKAKRPQISRCASKSSVSILSEKELHDRRYYSYHLLRLCSLIWTILVGIYYLQGTLMMDNGNFVSNRIFIQWMQDSLHSSTAWAMVFDTFFDILAKCFYLKIIVSVHRNVFDDKIRTKSQLGELRRLLQVLWDSTSDTILISVADPNKSSASTFLSPSFASFIEGGNDIGGVHGSTAKNHNAGLCHGQLGIDASNTTAAKFRSTGSGFLIQSMLNMTTSDPVCSSGGADCDRETDTKVLGAQYIDSSELSSFMTIDKLNVGTMDPSCRTAQIGSQLIDLCWQRFSSTQRQQQEVNSQDNNLLSKDINNGSSNSTPPPILVYQELQGSDGGRRFCELKISQPSLPPSIASSSSCSLLVIVRDVTERHLCFEAERKAHTEALARRKDAQNANRFTRHEIKNGLLSGIELCNGLQKAIDLLAKVEEDTACRESYPKANKNHPIPSEQHKSSDTSYRNRIFHLVQKHVSKVSGMIVQVDNVFHEILDTVLAEAMARDVIHGCYETNPKVTDLIEVLRSSCCGIGIDPRFPLHVVPSVDDIPKMKIDSQLLRFIHRNAFSNAIKYGKQGGLVSTNVFYQQAEGKLTLEVVNEPGPGHDKLLDMSEDAGNIVFEAGARLHVNNQDINESTNSLSAGDGAWIMQKCAKTLGGVCTIHFEIDRTVLRLKCPVAPVLPPITTNVATEEGAFSLPQNTWAIGIDDSLVQRKLIQRILTNSGIKQDKTIVIGKSLDELETIQKLIDDFLAVDATSMGLILVDENLDYIEKCGSRVIRSGSNVMQKVLQDVPPESSDRLLVLVRSANDSPDDVALYSERTHGFFPKTTTRKQDVIDYLEPLWKKRFHKHPSRHEQLITNASLPFSPQFYRKETKYRSSSSFSRDDVDCDEAVSSAFLLDGTKLSLAHPSSSSSSSTSSSEGGEGNAGESGSRHNAQLSPDNSDQRWASIRNLILDDGINEEKDIYSTHSGCCQRSPE